MSTLWRVDELTVRQVGVTELELEHADDFAQPHGGWIQLISDDEAVAGGAFRRYDGVTAKLERIWTSVAHRRRGLGRRVVAELEILAAVRGYRRIFLTAREPQSKALCLAAGYTQLGQLAFEKRLPKY